MVCSSVFWTTQPVQCVDLVQHKQRDHAFSSLALILERTQCWSVTTGSGSEFQGSTEKIFFSARSLCSWHTLQEPEGVLYCCPDTLLQWLCASIDRVCICSVGPPSATSEVHVGDGAVTVSPLYPSWLQPQLKCLCPGGSVPARKLQSRGTSDKVCRIHLQNHEQSCWHKPCHRSAGAQKPLLQGA